MASVSSGCGLTSMNVPYVFPADLIASVENTSVGTDGVRSASVDRSSDSR